MRDPLQATYNSLSDNIRARSVELLNGQLAAAIDLHAQVKQAHWNVRGPGFIGIHELFDKVAAEVEDWSDVLAERAAALGGEARGTVQIAAERSFLTPYTLGIASTEAHVKAVAGTLGAFGGRARAAIDEAGGWGDADTADILTSVSRGCDQQLWLVEAHLAPVTADQNL